MSAEGTVNPLALAREAGCGPVRLSSSVESHFHLSGHPHLASQSNDCVACRWYRLPSQFAIRSGSGAGGHFHRGRVASAFALLYLAGLHHPMTVNRRCYLRWVPAILRGRKPERRPGVLIAFPGSRCLLACGLMTERRAIFPQKLLSLCSSKYLGVWFWEEADSWKHHRSPVFDFGVANDPFPSFE